MTTNNKEYMRNYQSKRYKEDPKFREMKDGFTNRYRNTKKGKAYVKEYNSRQETKKRYKKWKKDNREYCNEEHKKYMIEYRKDPKNREKMRKYQEEYNFKKKKLTPSL